MYKQVLPFLGNSTNPDTIYSKCQNLLFQVNRKSFMENLLHEQKEEEVASCESRGRAWPCAAVGLSRRLVALLSGGSVTGWRQQGAAALYCHAAQLDSGETFVVLQAGAVKRGRVYTKLPGLHFQNNNWARAKCRRHWIFPNFPTKQSPSQQQSGGITSRIHKGNCTIRTMKTASHCSWNWAYCLKFSLNLHWPRKVQYTLFMYTFFLKRHQFNETNIVK